MSAEVRYRVKKGLSIIIILLANLLLLAHAVVPHHHHDRAIVCFSQICDDTHHSDGHDHTEGEPCSHGQGCNDDCVINDVYTRAENDHKFTCNVGCDHADSHDHFQFVTHHNVFNFESYGERPLRYKPPILTYQTITASLSIGLRAPPSC